MKYNNKVSAAGSGKPDFERVRQVSAAHREQHGGTARHHGHHHRYGPD